MFFELLFGSQPPLLPPCFVCNRKNILSFLSTRNISLVFLEHFEIEMNLQHDDMLNMIGSKIRIILGGGGGVRH